MKKKTKTVNIGLKLACLYVYCFHNIKSSCFPDIVKGFHSINISTANSKNIVDCKQARKCESSTNN